MNKGIGEKFQSLVSSLVGPVNILITQVDPDALASAFTLAYLIRLVRKENMVRVFYGGAISHAQNRTICNRLGLLDRMIPAAKMTEDDFKNLALVDSSMTMDGRCFKDRKLEPVIVIDHHRGGDVVQTGYNFVWIDEVGACATLLTELCVFLKVNLTEADQTIALLLALGIYTDTNSLISASERDFLAYNQTVSGIRNSSDLHAMFNYPLQAEHYENMKRALDQCRHEGAYLVASLGSIHATGGDDLSTIADYLIRREGVSLVVVWALIKEEKIVRISARCTDSSLDLCSFLRDRFGSSCGSKFTADGKAVGGGNMVLNFGFWFTPNTTPEVLALVKKFVDSAIFNKAV